MKRAIVIAVAVAVAAGAANAQMGEPLPELPYKNFTQTDAQSIADFAGRLVLVEVFAYW